MKKDSTKLDALLGLKLEKARPEGYKQVKAWAKRFSDHVIFDTEKGRAEFKTETELFYLQYDYDFEFNTVYQFSMTTFSPEITKRTGWVRTIDSAFEMLRDGLLPRI